MGSWLNKSFNNDPLISEPMIIFEDEQQTLTATIESRYKNRFKTYTIKEFQG